MFVSDIRKEFYDVIVNQVSEQQAERESRFVCIYTKLVRVLEIECEFVSVNMTNFKYEFYREVFFCSNSTIGAIYTS